MTYHFISAIMEWLVRVFEGAVIRELLMRCSSVKNGGKGGNNLKTDKGKRKRSKKRSVHARNRVLLQEHACVPVRILHLK